MSMPMSPKNRRNTFSKKRNNVTFTLDVECRSFCIWSTPQTVGCLLSEFEPMIVPESSPMSLDFSSSIYQSDSYRENESLLDLLTKSDSDSDNECETDVESEVPSALVTKLARVPSENRGDVSMKKLKKTLLKVKERTPRSSEKPRSEKSSNDQTRDKVKQSLLVLREKKVKSSETSPSSKHLSIPSASKDKRDASPMPSRAPKSSIKPTSPKAPASPNSNSKDQLLKSPVNAMKSFMAKTPMNNVIPNATKALNTSPLVNYCKQTLKKVTNTPPHYTEKK